ncbi:MAG: DUF445 domain-containing protein, partial [Acidimicrobiia bacterium]|nr:DUF445 domain-containing protein [Acidimicrobiia bacterium]
MKQRATGLLVLAALVFLGTFLLEDSGWVGYLRAGAEAAMVGGVADWFAVTALFRHPLGIPIPHTALIPRGKDAIGRGLGEFVTRNFLDADHLAERVQAADPAGTLAAWLADPDHAGSVAEHAARLAATLSGALDDADMQQHARAWLSDTVSRFDLAPIAASLATHAIEHGHHTPIIDTALRGVQSTLSESQTLLRNRMHKESPWWVPEQVDDAVFARIHVGLQRFISDVIADPDHELRRQFDQSLLKAAEEARTSPEWQRAADELRDGLLEHPATSAWIDSLWTDLQRTIALAAEQPEHEWRARLTTLVTSVGQRLETDEELRDR